MTLTLTTSVIAEYLNTSIINYMRLLVIEDNPANRKLLVEMLLALNYQADTAESADDAIPMLESRQYDIIFMDVRMPGMNGIELTQYIRTNSNNNQSVKIVAVTAEAMPSDREKCLQAGMDDYLAKPVSLDKLRLILEQYDAV